MSDRGNGRRSAACALAVLCSLVAVVGTSPGAARAGAGPSPIWPPLPTFDTTIAWADCGNGWECGTLNVPVDWAKPGGETVPLAITRRRATSDQRIGTLVVNPGGPGVTGTDYVRNFVRRLPAIVGERFDLVSWDPRGTAGSRPVDCVDDAVLDLGTAVPPVPDTAETLTVARRYVRAFARGCVERGGAYAGQVGTRNSARDLEAIRIALGEQKLTYLGFSYGSVLGMTYAQMFPSGVRAMVLDGPPDYWQSSLDYAHAQAAAFMQALDAFLAWCEQNASCALRTEGAPRDEFNALLTRFNASAVPAEYTAGGVTRTGSLTASDFETAVISMLYDERAWPTLGRALLSATHDDAGPLLQLADAYLGRGPDGVWTPLLEANAVISCVDRPDPKPRSAARELADVERFQSELPPWGGAWAVSSCAGMPKAARGDKLGDVRVRNTPPILVVGTTGDPATPYAGATAVVNRIAGAGLLTFQSTEHTGYGTGRSSCVDDVVDAYLADGTMPSPGTTCGGG